MLLLLLLLHFPLPLLLLLLLLLLTTATAITFHFCLTPQFCHGYPSLGRVSKSELWKFLVQDSQRPWVALWRNGYDKRYICDEQIKNTLRALLYLFSCFHHKSTYTALGVWLPRQINRTQYDRHSQQQLASCYYYYHVILLVHRSSEVRMRWDAHRVVSNSSSFSAIRRSISWRILDSSRCARAVLASSCSRAASASSSAAWSSSFSSSRRRRTLSISWTLRPPSPSCSVRSWISSIHAQVIHVIITAAAATATTTTTTTTKVQS